MQSELIECVEELERTLPARIPARTFDKRYPSERALERAYNAYALAHMRLRAVDDLDSNHAELDEASKNEMFAERLPALEKAEAEYRRLEKKCEVNAKRRLVSHASSRASETAQRHLFVERWPAEYRYIAERFPYRPRCTNNPKVEGTKTRPLHEAQEFRGIQFNTVAYIHLLIIDYDARDGIDVRDVWQRAGVAKPNFIISNLNNGKGHIAYALKTPIPRKSKNKNKKGESSAAAAMRYFESIRFAYNKALGGDLAFTHDLTKNPVHVLGAFETIWLNPNPYTLGELASFVTLPTNVKAAKREAKLIDEHEQEEEPEPAQAQEQPQQQQEGKPKRKRREINGRNDRVFWSGYDWAVHAIRQYWGGTYEAWEAAVTAQVEAFNAMLDDPLPEAEIKSIRNSIARYTWSKTTPGEFSKLQAKRGERGGQRSGVTRLAKAQVRSEVVQELKSAGMNNTAIAERLGVTRRTVINLLKLSAAG